MLTLSLIGLIAGFCSATPPGPINMWLLELTLRGGPLRARAVPFLAGVILADVSFGLLAYWGQGELVQERLANRSLGAVAALFMIGLGLWSVRSLWPLSPATAFIPRRRQASVPRRASAGGDFFLGLTLCSVNPAFLLFWLYIIGTARLHGIAGGEPSASLAFAAGIITGNVLWFTGLLALVRKGQERVDGGLIWKLRVGIALAFIAAGILGLWQTV